MRHDAFVNTLYYVYTHTVFVNSNFYINFFMLLKGDCRLRTLKQNNLFHYTI